MSDDARGRQQELEEIDKSIKRSTIKYWVWQISHWVSAVAIAIAGFLNTFAGAHESTPAPWYGTSNSLIIYGIIGVALGVF